MQRPDCATGIMIAKIGPASVEQIVNARNNGVSWADIGRALKAAGYDVPAQCIRRHFAKECACEKRAAASEKSAALIFDFEQK